MEGRYTTALKHLLIAVPRSAGAEKFARQTIHFGGRVAVFASAAFVMLFQNRSGIFNGVVHSGSQPRVEIGRPFLIVATKHGPPVLLFEIRFRRLAVGELTRRACEMRDEPDLKRWA